MKVNGYEVDVWYDWDGHNECPIPDGYKYQVMFRGSSVVQNVYQDEVLRWGHKGSRGDIVNFKIVVDEPSDMIIDDDHPNFYDTKWNGCSLTSGDIERIRVIAPKAYREIDRLLEVIEGLREIEWMYKDLNDEV